MKSLRNTLTLLMLGLVAIGSALWYRQRALRHKPVVRPVAAHAVNGLLLSQTAVLQNQAVRLKARIATRPDDVASRQALLLTYQQLGQFDGAMEQLNALVRLQPNNPNAHVALANARLAMKQWPQAEQTYGAIVRRWPAQAAAWQGLAAARYHQGHFEEAAVAAKKAQALQPKNPSVRYVLAASLMEYAMQYPEPQLHSTALDWSRREFEKLTQTWPDKGDLYLRLGRICLETRDAQGAIHNMEKAAQLLPNQSDASLYLAKAYASSRNQQAARQVLESGLAHNPNSADLNDALGQLVQSSGEPNADQNALALFQKAAQLAPGNSRFQERLGTAYLRAGNLEQARQTFEQAARLNPNRAFPFQQLAVVYARLHDTKRADEASKVTEALNFNAQQLSHLEAMVNAHQENVAMHLTLADRYRFLGSLGAARNEYLTVLRLDPQNARAQTSLRALDAPRSTTVTASVPPAANIGSSASGVSSTIK